MCHVAEKWNKTHFNWYVRWANVREPFHPCHQPRCSCILCHGVSLVSGVGLCDREGRVISDHRIRRHGAESVERVLQSTGMSRFFCLVDGNLQLQVMSDLACLICLNLLKRIKDFYSVFYDLFAGIATKYSYFIFYNLFNFNLKLQLLWLYH